MLIDCNEKWVDNRRYSSADYSVCARVSSLDQNARDKITIAADALTVRFEPGLP